MLGALTRPRVAVSLNESPSEKEGKCERKPAAFEVQVMPQ